jgi:hypothetical protein
MLLAPPKPQAEESPPVGCLTLPTQYIRSYPPYLKAVSSIRNPRTRHAVVTVDPLNMVCIRLLVDYFSFEWRSELSISEFTTYFEMENFYLKYEFIIL